MSFEPSTAIDLLVLMAMDLGLEIGKQERQAELISRLQREIDAASYAIGICHLSQKQNIRSSVLGKIIRVMEENGCTAFFDLYEERGLLPDPETSTAENQP